MFRRYYDRFNSAAPMTRLILVAAVVMVVVILIPRIPGAGQGISCNDMTRPFANGSNQSILATRADPSVLTIDLQPENPALVVGERLVLNVRFYNSSLAPISLLFAPQEVVLRYTGQEMGLVLLIQDVNGTPIGETFAVRPRFAVRQQFDPNDLRMLGPRSFCGVRIEIDGERLRRAGLTGGQYRLTAVYRNDFAGGLSRPGQLTPTPIFANQGVWTGEIRSQQVLITIGAAPTPVQ